ncbi:MAG: hypothetical protein HDR36_04255 [Treponema sp.]|nr:hypothetical protein [Treponema sp.]
MFSWNARDRWNAVARPGAIFAKTRLGGASPAQKRLPPEKVFLVLARFLRKPVWVVLPQRESGFRPNGFSSPRRVFFENLVWRSAVSLFSYFFLTGKQTSVT